MARCSLKFCVTALLCAVGILCICMIVSSLRGRRYVISTGGVLVAFADAEDALDDSQRKDVAAGDATRRRPESEIPRLLHLASETEMALSAYRATMTSCALRNPDWTVYLWTNEDVELLLRWRQPDLLDFYRHLGSQSERQEFAKYPVLYYVGGVALEPDVDCVKPLTVVTEDPAARSAFLSEERRENAMIYENRMFRLSPAAMGSKARHAFFAYAIDILLGRVSVENLTLDKAFLTESYRQWATEDQDSAAGLAILSPEVFSPRLRDPETMRLLCRYHRDANLTQVYSVRGRGCAMLEADEGRNVSESTVGVHLHLQLHWLSQLNNLLHPSGPETNSSIGGGGDTVGGSFNATEALSARRYSQNLIVNEV